MRIAIQINCLEQGSEIGISDFMVRLIFSLAEQQPYHQFILIGLGVAKPTLNFPHNVEPVFLKPLNKLLPFAGWLNDAKVATALKRCEADVCISSNTFFSLTKKIPQVLLVCDPEFMNRKGVLIINKNALRLPGKAKIICTVSEVIRQEIIARYKVHENKIFNIGFFAAQEFQPAIYGNSEITKEAYADGYEYFLFPMTAHMKDNFINLLKAFSLFKKRQKSNMKFLVVDASLRSNNDVLEKLKTFKFRDDVRVLGNIGNEEIAKIFSSAYAVLFPCANEIFPYPILQAMQCEVPVITSNMKSITEIGGDALLYADASNPQDIAEQMKVIFKDEQLRNKLIAAAKRKAESFTAQKTTGMLWQAIQQAVLNN